MTMTFHEIQAEINRLETKLQRQRRVAEQTDKLIESLRQLQTAGEPKAPAKR